MSQRLAAQIPEGAREVEKPGSSGLMGIEK